VVEQGEGREPLEGNAEEVGERHPGGKELSTYKNNFPEYA